MQKVLKFIFSLEVIKGTRKTSQEKLSYFYILCKHKLGNFGHSNFIEIMYFRAKNTLNHQTGFKRWLDLRRYLFRRAN